MTKSKIFLWLSVSFISGIFLRSVWQKELMLLEYFLLIAGIIILTLFYKNKRAAVAAFCVLFFTFGVWRTENRLSELDNLNLDGKEYFGKAVVAKEPEQKDNYKNIIVKTDKGFRILLRTNLYSDFSYGDELNLKCALEIPENKAEDFDYRMYLSKDRIYYLCQKAEIEKTGENKGSKIYGFILKLKNKMADNINQVIPYPYSALGNGLIFGGSSELPKNLKDNFSRTGMTHIIAVSGYNVTIIAEYLILFGIWIGLWRKQAFWFAIFGIIIFVAMIGFPSSAVRAGVMGGLLLWAMKNGRLANSWNAIIFAAAVMLFLNPLLLRFDIGFQLSFLAAIGIITLAPFWEKYLIKKHRALGFTEIFFLTLSAQIFVMPIIVYNFHTLSLVSLLANVLILLIIPISMLLVFLTAVSGFIFAPLSLIFAWLTYLPLRYEIEIINLLAGFKWASREVNNFSLLMLAAWYAVLISAVLYLKKIMKRKKTETIKEPEPISNV